MRRPSLLSLLSLLLLSSLGCGEPSVTLAPVDPPERTAAEDRSLRALVRDVASARACGELRDRFVPLPEDRPRRRGERPNVTGRLWLNDCEVAPEGETLSLHVAGRGWQWVERSSEGPLGSSFTVRGVLRVEASLDLRGETDVRYDREGHGLRIALTPIGAPRASVTPIGEIPVAADGSWSGLIGSLGGLLGGGNVQDRARPIVESQGAQTMRDEMREGATLAVDLCTGQVDPLLGALDDGVAPPGAPYPADGRQWWENLTVLLHPGAMDLAGPFEPNGESVGIDLEVQEGGGAHVALVCRDEAARLASSFLAGAAPVVSGAISERDVRPGRALHLDVTPTCAKVALVVTPLADEQAVLRYRYRVGRAGATSESFVDCSR